MEAMKMKLYVVVLVAVIAFSTVHQTVAAVDAPAPSPTSDASSFIPTFFASVAKSINADMMQTETEKIGYRYAGSIWM
ncbi:unnamed protein product [Arabidopsis thaliana]|uniref:Transmembrane protein n=1 Tax=Arabidopsis thaliana TaxID=3702 RepID=A0A654GBJ8_ARATH|nr:unnamed protein product [Arabidopsis thaliana]